MSNFKSMLYDVLLEKDKTFEDLVSNGIICERTYYRYKNDTPYLSTVIKIANYLQVSLDYLSGRVATNNFKKYSENQTGFYNKLIAMLKSAKMTRIQLCSEANIGKSNFMYWRNGRLPKLNSLISIADHLNCSIDDLLDLEN